MTDVVLKIICGPYGHLCMALWHVTPTASWQVVCFEDRFVGVTLTPSSNQHTHKHTVLAHRKILINEMLIFIKENIYTYINVYYIKNIYMQVYIIIYKFINLLHMHAY